MRPFASVTDPFLPITPMSLLWAPVPILPFNEFYEVSNDGQVRALTRWVTESSGVKRRHRGRILAPQKVGAYLAVTLCVELLHRRFYIHRLVGMSFIPNPDTKPCINHKNRNTHDNHVENLEWVTYSENSRHLVRSTGYVPPPSTKGEEHYCSKFDDATVRHLRLHWKPGDSCSEITKAYQVTPRAVYQMLRGNTWKHVDPPIAIHWSRA